MVTVEDLLTSKGRQVYSSSPDSTVYEALTLMADKSVGALVVVQDDTLVGIISERDYARKIILKGKFSKNTLVREIMATEIVSVSPNETAERCMELMTDRLIRHMPVLENGRLVGLISIGDVVKSVISSQEVNQRVINALLHHSLEDISLDQLLKHALDLILSIPWLSFEKQGSIFVVENDPNTLVMKAESGLSEPIKGSCARLPFGKCLCGRAATTKKLQFADCVDGRHEIRYDGLISHGHYCVPICYEGETLGVINIYVREGHQRSQREEDFLMAVANTLAGIIMRKRLAEELVQSERLAAVGQTVAGLAHCIKSILFGLEGGIYIVNKAFRKDDMQKLRTGWNMVRKNIDKVSNLVVDLLDYSKERAPQYEICSPNIIAEEVCELIEYKTRDIPLDRIEIIRDLEPHLGEFLLDPKGIHRCLLNLVDNAIDACLSDEEESKNHRVKVITRLQGDGTLMLQVSDNGCGMSEEVRKHILTAFYTTKGSKGTGLGLLITQKIVQEQGGVLSVDSQAGKGSVFTILLPVKPQSR
jgi:signal transduction histidine kinase/CBS domain-containing protein